MLDVSDSFYKNLQKLITMDSKYIDLVIQKYADRKNEISPEEAIDIIGQMYIDSCGISRSDRTIAENASWYWVKRMKETHPDLPQDAEMFYIMEQRLEEYRLNKERIDKYEITVLDNEWLNRVTLANIKETDDDKKKIALAVGIASFIKNGIVQ